ncbi:MAG: 16S rRNA (uracil(1498)-N(3))-methyltransferase [Polyangiaceae bacterium]
MARPPPRLPLSGLGAGARALDADQARYLGRVLRLGEGEAIVAFDPEAELEADAVLRGTGSRLAVELGPPRPATRRPRRRVTLLQGTGKGDKLDAIVRDATELGAVRLVPVLTARSVARPAAERGARWRRIAVEAARQCGRGDLLRVEEPLPLAEALPRFARAPGACFAPGGEAGLGAFVRAAAASAEVCLLVGPEGGLEAGEIEAARAAGLWVVGLGPLVLRTETVCAAARGARLALDDAG